jgi:hypothetical protein
MSAVAHADDARTVEKLLLQNLSSLDSPESAGYAKDAVADFGMIEDSPLRRQLVMTDERGTVTAGKVITIMFDATGELAWFLVPYERDGAPRRFGGLAIKTADGWRIAAAMYSELATDAELDAPERVLGTPHGTDPPHLDGDPTLAKQIASWFKTGIANHAAKTSLIASGTASKAVATNAAAIKLVRSWSAHNARATSISATLFADGRIAFVQCQLELPRKKGTIGLAMTFIAIRVGDDWNWVSVQTSA